jgi:hypothetical protein
MEVLRRTLVMDVPGFVRLLKRQTMSGADCWNSVPAEREELTPHMIAKHSEIIVLSNDFLPQKFSAIAPVIGVCATQLQWIVQTVLKHGAKRREQADCLPDSLSASDAACRPGDQQVFS